MNPTAAPSGKYLRCLLWLLLAALIGVTLLLAATPPVDRDGLTHHLFVPKLWLLHGGISAIPEIPFSYYPMNLDLLYMIPLAFGNDILPKYIHYLFALLTAGLLFAHIRKRLGTACGLLGALFFLSIPVILKLSITVYVDLGLIFFTTASLLALLRWAESGRLRFLVLAGLCCGLAAGTKYNGLIGIVVLSLLVPFMALRMPDPGSREKTGTLKALAAGLLFLLLTLAAFSPWLIRNALLTGNPIYPLHNGLIQRLVHPEQAHRQATDGASSGDSLARDLLSFASKGSGALITRKILYNEPGWQTALLPLRMFFEGRDDDPRFFDGKLNPFLLILPLAGFLFRPKDKQQGREQTALACFALLFFLFTFLQEATRIRYIAPIIPPLVILSLYGLHGLLAAADRLTAPGTRAVARAGIGGALCLGMLGYNASYLDEQFRLVQPLAYLRGEVSREAYISAFRPEYAAISQANRQLAPETKVFCIFLGNRGYYMDFQPIFEQPTSPGSFFARFLARKDNTILEALREQGIRYVLLRDDLSLDWFNKQLKPEEQERLLPLFEGTARPLFQGQGHTFFQVPDPGATP